MDATYDRYVAVGSGGITSDVAGNRLNNAPEWSGRLWLEWTGNVGRSTRMTLTADATAQSTVFYFGASPVAFGGRPGPSRHAGIQLIIGR